MRYLAIIAAGAILAGASVSVNAAPVSSAGFKTETSPIVLAQAKKETTTEKVKAKVKRAWKRVAGYKFAVGCPVFPTLTTKTCTETGKDKEAARAKCAAQNPLCSVRETK
jgi:hypothetical protein